MEAVTAPSTAAGVRWDLTRVFADTASARATLDSSVTLAGILEARAAAIDDLEPSDLLDLLGQASALAEVRDLFHDEYGYSALRLLADASDVEARDLVAESANGLATIR